MEFNNLAKKRASIRKYTDKKPEIEDIIKCIEIANLAPSPGNLALLKYLIVEDPEKIEKIAQACQQDFIKQSQILIVICSEQKNATTTYDARGKKYTKQHAGAAIQNLLLKITDMGLASCWIGAFSDLTIKNILAIPEDIEIEALFPVGYQLKTDKATQRKKPLLENRIYFGTWKNKFRKPYAQLSD